ncbi:unnamed protein product [Chrysoparadoxa australica]
MRGEGYQERLALPWCSAGTLFLFLYFLYTHPAADPEHLSRHPPRLEKGALVSTEEGGESGRMPFREGYSIPSQEPTRGIEDSIPSQEPTRGIEDSILNQKPTRGILWLHHIPKNGGSSVQKQVRDFLEKRGKSGPMVPYLHFWDIKRIGERHPLPYPSEMAEGVADYCLSVLDEIEEWLKQPPSPEEPLLVICHRFSCGGMLLMAPVIQRFRRMIESQGGALHFSTLLRKPLAQTVSHLTSTGHATIQSMEETLRSNDAYDNFQVRFLLHDGLKFFRKELMERYEKFDANLLDGPDAEEEKEGMRHIEEYPPLSGINAQHVVTALGYLDEVFDFVGETRHLPEYFDELEAFIGQFVDTSAWSSGDVHANAEGVDARISVKREVASWRGAPPALKELLVSSTRYDAAFFEEAMKLKKQS